MAMTAPANKGDGDEHSIGELLRAQKRARATLPFNACLAVVLVTLALIFSYWGLWVVAAIATFVALSDGLTLWHSSKAIARYREQRASVTRED